MRNHFIKGFNKERVTAIVALLSFTAYMPVSTMSAFADDMVGANTLPSLNAAANGYVNTDGNTMNVNVYQQGAASQNGVVGQFDWNTFNVGRDARVNWTFSGNSQTALNRVLSTGGMSYIYGKLTESSATGCPACVNTSKVILINPSGILFGNGSSVNLNSFTASTYDIKGAKDLNTLIEGSDAYNAYVKGGAGVSGSLFNIAGYNDTVQFVANDNMVNGNGYLVSDGTGTKLASIIGEGTNIKADKTIAMVGNKIDLKDSNLKTHYNETPNASNGRLTRSNIKLVTGDGVNFQYTAVGNAESQHVVTNTPRTAGNGKKYGINLDNSELRSGNITISNYAKGSKEDSNIDIDKSTIYAMKLHGGNYSYGGVDYKPSETGEYGEILIENAGITNISNSNIQSVNAPKLDENGNVVRAKVDSNNNFIKDANGNYILDPNGVIIPTTTDVEGGNIVIVGDGDINITDTHLLTATTDTNTAGNVNSGNIKITSNEGNVNIKKVNGAPDVDGVNYGGKTLIHSSGNIDIRAAKKATIDGYDRIIAKDGNASYKDRSITITSGGHSWSSGDPMDTIPETNIKNTKLEATNIGVASIDSIRYIPNAIAMTMQRGTINTENANFVADNIELAANNTNLDSSLLEYNELNFGDKEMTISSVPSYANNVTISNGTTLYDKDSSELTVTTNGNLTVDNSNLQKKAYGSSTASNQNGINLISTRGDVTVKNSGNIVTPKVSLIANEGNVDVTSSNFTGDNTNSFTAKASGNRSIDINNANITKYVPVDLTAGNINVDNSKITASELKAYSHGSILAGHTITEGKINFTNSNITSSKVDLTATFGDIDITNSRFTGDNTNSFTATTFSKDVNINNSYITEYAPVGIRAGKDINIDNSTIATDKGDINIASANKAGNVTITTDKQGTGVFDTGSTIGTNNGNINIRGNKVIVTGTKAVAMNEGGTSRSNVIALGTGGFSGKVTIDQTADLDMTNDYLYANIMAESKLTLNTEGNLKGDGFNSGSMKLGNTNNVPTLSNANTLFTLGSNGGELKAGKDLDLTHSDNLKDLDLEGNNVNVSGDGPMVLTNIKTKSNPTGETKLTSGGDIDINGLKIKPDSGKTTITGNNIKTPNGNKIDANHNKVALNGNGDIDINVSHIDNPRNGLEINANLNTGIHDNNKYSQDVLNGRNVKVNAGGETLAISKIKADTLDLTAGKFVKGDTNITNEWDNLGIVKPDGSLEQVIPDSNNSKGYIEVKTDGGFKINNTTDGATYGDNSGKIAYDKNVGTKVIKTEEIDNGERFTKLRDKNTTTETYFLTDENGNPITTVETVDNGETVKVDSTTKNVGEPYRENIYDTNGDLKGYYTHQDTETTVTTTTTHSYTDNTYKLSETKETTVKNYDVYQGKSKTTTQREQQHIATFNESGEQQGFVLVYGKTSTNTEPTDAVIVDHKTETSTKITQTGFVDPATRGTTGLVSSNDRHTDTVKVVNFKGKTSTWCDAEPPIRPTRPLTIADDGHVSVLAKNPRLPEGTSDNASINNGITDASGAAISAAARLNLDEDGNSIPSDLDSIPADSNYDNDDDFYYGE